MPKIGATKILPTVLALCLVSATVHAQDRGIGGTATANAPGESRVALVIGNAAYAQGPLRNPANDARDVAAALRTFGFDVIERTDCDLRVMKQTLKDFGQRIAGGGVALFYYAGHGIQADGHNYLVPLGADMAAENEAEFECLDAGRVLAKMENAGTRVNIVILDACRNNPFARTWRSSTKGLVAMDAAKGTILSYATAPGSVASDGTERNGIYTGRLLKHIATPGLPIERIFKQVREDVARATEDRQIPWENSSLIGDFFFVSPAGDPAVPPTATVAAVPQTSAPPPPAPPSMLGHLQVAVNAPSAEVTVDGRRVGTASLSEALNVSGLAVGAVSVHVEAQGYEPVTQEVTIERNQWTQIAVELPRTGVADVREAASPLRAQIAEDIKACERLWMSGGDSNEYLREVVASRLDAWRRAAEQGWPEGQWLMAKCFLTGIGVAEDETAAVTWYRKAAEQDYASAQINLGACYALGQGVAKDEEEAVTWYRKAAEQDHVSAQINLGACYALGQGVAKDEEEAVTWYRKAAEQDYASAQCNLGQCYALGQGVAKDEEEAVTWFRKAAEQDYASAQSWLGYCYEQGRGVAKDEEEALKWYRKAAEQDAPFAIYRLGRFYENGLGVQKDLGTAVQMYRKVAEKGDMDGQAAYARCRLYGIGVMKDEAEAAKWYRKAMDQGFELGEEERKLLEQYL